MAFLGGIGKALGISTPEAINIGASFAAGGPLGAIVQAAKSLGEQDVPRAAQQPSLIADVSAGPSAVDSPATVAPVSQTSQLTIPVAQQGFGGPMQAGLAAPLGNVITGVFGQAARTLAKPGVGGLLGGLAVGEAVDFFVDQFGQQKKLVITRKMQRDVKKLFMMSGGDFNMTAELYRMATGRQISGEQVVKIITKTFKNQGPYVTKAAVRKTRATIRKMETLCDLKDRLCPPKTARRRTPARRSSTMITQVK